MVFGLLSVVFTGYRNLGLKIIYFDFHLLNVVLTYCTAGTQLAKRDSNAWPHRTTGVLMVCLLSVLGL